MACIHELIKGQDTYRADSEQTVLELAKAMVERNIGAVPVLHNGELVGVFSERDLMKRVVVAGLDPASTRVGEVMTPNPHTVEPATEVERCMVLMHQHGFRHLLICDGKVLVGMVSLRDIMSHDINEKDYDLRMMRAYIQAVPGA
jgi:CBS domain-containing protein